MIPLSELSLNNERQLSVSIESVVEMCVRMSDRVSLL